MKEKTGRIALLIVIAAACALTIAAVVAGEYLRGAVYGGRLPYTLELAFGITQRMLLSVAAVCLMIAFGVTAALRPRLRGGVTVTLAGTAVALANFPFFCLADGSLAITTDAGGFALFVVHCLSVGLFEETAFRGFVFPLILGKTADKKYGVTIAVLASSAIFALVHLFNILQGAGVGATLMQVGYTFLVGCMCNVILIATRSLAMPVLVHALFDVGGTITTMNAAEGSSWNAPAIAVMAVVSVATAAYLIYWFFRHRERALLLLPPADTHSAA